MNTRTPFEELLSTIRYGEHCEGWGMAVEDDIARACKAGTLTEDEAQVLLTELEPYAIKPGYS